jgi:hypothetical protein
MGPPAPFTKATRRLCGRAWTPTSRKPFSAGAERQSKGPAKKGSKILRPFALDYEDLNDHDELRHDPVLAVLVGKLAAKRADCAPLAGKSTLNRLELSRPEATRYHKVSHDPAAIETLFVAVFLEAYRRPPTQIILDLDATDDPLHGHQEGRFFHGYCAPRRRGR